MEKSLISVLIPVYNVDRYVFDAVSSILNQTYNNIELIIVDDCSTDNTYNILLNMEKLDSRIKLYRNKENLKIVKTLNFAFRKSSGEYILRMDGDDLSDIQRIEKKLKYLLSNDLDIVGCSTISIDSHNNILSKYKSISSHELIKKTCRYRTPILHIWLSKRKVYEVLDGYRDIPGVEDYDFILRAMDYGFKISNITDYYGYQVRIARDGNTNHLLGLKQKKMHKYVWKLHKKRILSCCDDFHEEDINFHAKAFSISYFLYAKSSFFLNKAFIYKADNRFIASFLFFLLSLCSPHQIINYFELIKYKVILACGE